VTKNAVKRLRVASVIVGSNGACWAQDIDLGKSEFQSSCAACHGIDGKGKGPVSAQLKVAPADLTVLAKNNKGVFPFSAVYEAIDGRQAIIAHGPRDMPIWGMQYNLSQIEQSVRRYSPLDPEAVVRTRILAIIDYLNRIQEK
jgi:mono/diheme cytochrome c family protein